MTYRSTREEYAPGTRVTRVFDGAVGTVESIQPYDSDSGDYAIAVRLDRDGEVWSGTEAAWLRVDDPTPARTWNGAPAIVYRDDHGWIVNLPEGHADLGYAPGSMFYASTADLADLEGTPLPSDDDLPPAQDGMGRQVRRPRTR